MRTKFNVFAGYLLFGCGISIYTGNDLPSFLGGIVYISIGSFILAYYHIKATSDD